jgi:hypothetical protein
MSSDPLSLITDNFSGLYFEDKDTLRTYDDKVCLSLYAATGIRGPGAVWLQPVQRIEDSKGVVERPQGLEDFLFTPTVEVQRELWIEDRHALQGIPAKAICDQAACGYIRVHLLEFGTDVRTIQLSK